MADLKGASVVFHTEHNKSYDFLTDETLYPGDLVIVPTPYGSLGYTVAKVTATIEHPSPHAKKWIIQRIDVKDYQVSDKQQQLKQVRVAMKHRRKELGLKMPNRTAAQYDDEINRLYMKSIGLKQQVDQETGGE